MLFVNILTVAKWSIASTLGFWWVCLGVAPFERWKVALGRSQMDAGWNLAQCRLWLVRGDCSCRYETAGTLHRQSQCRRIGKFLEHYSIDWLHQGLIGALQLTPTCLIIRLYMIHWQDLRIGDQKNIWQRSAVEKRVSDGCSTSDSCAKGDVCPSGAICTDMWNSHTCTCQPGTLHYHN